MSSPQQRRTPPPVYEPPEYKPPEHAPPESEPPEYKPPNAHQTTPQAQLPPSMHTTQTQHPLASPNPSHPPPPQPPVIVVQPTSPRRMENYDASKSRALGKTQIVGGVMAISFQGVLMIMVQFVFEKPGASYAYKSGGFYSGFLVSKIYHSLVDSE